MKDLIVPAQQAHRLSFQDCAAQRFMKTILKKEA